MIWEKAIDLEGTLNFFFFFFGECEESSLMGALERAWAEFQKPFIPVSLPLITKSSSPL